MDAGRARAALIIAAELTGAPGDGLCATLPVLGATLVEHQVRQAVAAGAAHVVVLVATMPAALLAALDRLRRDGTDVEVARGLADAADRLHPEETVLLIADGCLADQALVARMAACPAPALLVRPAGADMAFERLDAMHGWGGIATVDGALVRRTATMPGEWDAQSVIVRRAVQAGAVRIEAGEVPPRLMRAAGPRDPVAPSMLAASRARTGAWTARWLYAPVEAIALRLLGPRAIDPLWLGLGSAVLTLVALTLVTVEQPGWGLAAFLVSGPLLSTARRLARLRLGRLRFAAAVERVRWAAGAAGLVAIAARMSAWGWLALAMLTVAAMLALSREGAMLRRRRHEVPAMTADGDALAWGMLAGLSMAGWSGAVAVAAGYAVLSFALVQDRLARAV